MLGMIGIIVKNSQIQNTIQIVGEVKPGEKYLCRFLNAPAFSRVCNVEEIQSWLLFQDQDEANTWVTSSQQPPPEAMPPRMPPPKPPAPATGGNGAVNKADAAEGSEPEKQDETTDEPSPIIPAKPVAPLGRHEQFTHPDDVIPGEGDDDDNLGKKS